MKVTVGVKKQKKKNKKKNIEIFFFKLKVEPYKLKKIQS